MLRCSLGLMRVGVAQWCSGFSSQLGCFCVVCMFKKMHHRSTGDAKLSLGVNVTMWLYVYVEPCDRLAPRWPNDWDRL